MANGGHQKLQPFVKISFHIVSLVAAYTGHRSVSKPKLIDKARGEGGKNINCLALRRVFNGC